MNIKNIFKTMIIASFFFAVCCAPTFASTTDNLNTSVKIFKNISAENNKLSASKIIQSNAEITKIKITNNFLSITGFITDEDKFDIQGKFIDNKISTAQDLTKNYKVISISCINGNMRLVLKKDSENKMIYVDINGYKDTPQDNIFYNRYWYTKILKPEKIEIPARIRRSMYNIPYKDTFEHKYDIYGDKYTEILEVSRTYQWPEETNGNLEDFISTIYIKSKKTKVEEYKGKTYTFSGCSLEVCGASFDVATDTGEYVDSIQTYQNCHKFGGGLNVEISFWIDIPKLPFGITTSYEKSEELSDGDNGYFEFARYCDGNKKAVKIGASWDEYKYHLTKVNHFFKAESHVGTDKNYEKKGEKLFKTQWNYCVVSGGTDYDEPIASPTFNEYKTKTNTLHYDLK